MFKPIGRVFMGLLVCVLLSSQGSVVVSQSGTADDDPNQARFIPHEQYSGNISPKSRQLYEEGTRKLRAGDYQEAIGLFLEAVLGACRDTISLPRAA